MKVKEMNELKNKSLRAVTKTLSEQGFDSISYDDETRVLIAERSDCGDVAIAFFTKAGRATKISVQTK